MTLHKEIDFQRLSHDDRHNSFNRIGHTLHERRAYESHYFLCVGIPDAKTYEEAHSLIHWANCITKQLKLRMRYTFKPVVAMQAWVVQAELSLPYDESKYAVSFRGVTAATRLRRPTIPALNQSELTPLSNEDQIQWRWLYRDFLTTYPIDYGAPRPKRYFTDRAFFHNEEKLFTFTPEEKLTLEGVKRQQMIRDHLAIHGDFLD